MKIRVVKLLKLEVGRRVSNWAMARAQGESIRSAMRRIGTGGGFVLAGTSRVFTGTRIPVLYGEAEETEKVLTRLREPQRRALELQYLRALPVQQRAQEMGLTERTYYRLVDSAHVDFFRQLKSLQNIGGGDR